MSSCKVAVILVRFLITLEFSPRNFEKYSNIKSHILPVGAELLRAHRQTDRHTDIQTDRQTERHDEAKSRFSQFYGRALKTRILQSSLGHVNQLLCFYTVSYT